jgi:excisionase family DNA binding protein
MPATTPKQPPLADGDKLLTVKQAAAILALSRSTTYELLDAGKLRYARLPGTGERANRRVRLSDVHTLIAESMTTPGSREAR